MLLGIRLSCAVLRHRRAHRASATAWVRMQTRHRTGLRGALAALMISSCGLGWPRVAASSLRAYLGGGAPSGLSGSGAWVVGISAALLYVGELSSGLRPVPLGGGWSVGPSPLSLRSLPALPPPLSGSSPHAVVTACSGPVSAMVARVRVVCTNRHRASYASPPRGREIALGAPQTPFSPPGLPGSLKGWDSSPKTQSAPPITSGECGSPAALRSP